MLPGQVTFNKPISGENAKSNKLKYVIFGDFLIMKIASMKLVGTPCMTFLSILTQVSFKGQFWLSFDDTDFLCPHPNISFEAKNHPKNLPNFFVPFCQAEPLFLQEIPRRNLFFSWLLIGFPLFSALVTLTKESCPPPIVSSDTLSFSCF